MSKPTDNTNYDHTYDALNYMLTPVVHFGGRTQGKTYLAKQRIEQLRANGVLVAVYDKRTKPTNNSEKVVRNG